MTPNRVAASVFIVMAGVVVGLVVALLLLPRPKKNTSGTTQNVTPTGTTSQQGTITCSVQSESELVPCVSQSECSSCAEQVGGFPYACVAITGEVDKKTGLLVTPAEVTYEGSETGSVRKVSVSTPGSYCMPPYMNKCDPSVSNTVLQTDATGTMRWSCACKSEYTKLLTQKTEGGDCSVPKVCGSLVTQRNPDGSEKMFSVFNHMGEDGIPVFTNKAVYPNRLVSWNKLNAREACVAKTITTNTGKDGGYRVVEVDRAASDPTCTPQEFSNFCEATVAVHPSSDTPLSGTTMVVRGSGRVGDPLRTRVTPAFFEPVPPGLQRCPDHFVMKASGVCECACVDGAPENTGTCDGRTAPCKPASGSCECASGNEVAYQLTTRSHCSDDSKATTNEEYQSTWHSSAWDTHGDWNGAFTCLSDLKNARLKVGDREGVTLSWRTVKQLPMNPVECLHQEDVVWADRSDEKDGVFGGESGGVSCVGGECQGVKGWKVSPWNGARDGPLLSPNEGLPWFATQDKVFGGQCECMGEQGGVRQVAQYMVPSEGEESWWQCAPDLCSLSSVSPSTAHFDLKNELTAYPQCVCASAAIDEKTGDIVSEVSFREHATELPRCIRDPCNPNGMKTSAKVTCAGDADCGGTCYKNKCYYKSSTHCSSDSECASKRNTFNAYAGLNVVCGGSDDPDSKVCMVEDGEREGGCEQNSDCDMGKCTNVQENGHGTCSGGCACKTDWVQQTDNANPVGYVCKKRCDAYPCYNEGSSCKINALTLARECTCSACFVGAECEKTTQASRLYGYCEHGKKHNEINGCCSTINCRYNFCDDQKKL